MTESANCCCFRISFNLSEAIYRYNSEANLHVIHQSLKDSSHSMPTSIHKLLLGFKQ